jgi:hypothetical protein
MKLKTFSQNKIFVQSKNSQTDMNESDVLVDEEHENKIQPDETQVSETTFPLQEPITNPSDTSDDSEKNLVESVEPKTSYFIELINVIILGFSFMFLFAAFNTTANYMSTLHKGFHKKSFNIN